MALDGLRGVVALGVAMMHSSPILGRQPIVHGYLAVDFFFLLSGFVIAEAYEDKLQYSMSFLDFAIVRAVRLYPMIVWGAITGSISIALVIHPPAFLLASGTAAAALVLPFYSSGKLGPYLWPINPPAWSLFWEIAVNMVFAAGIFRCSNRTLLAICALGLGSIVAVVMNFHTIEAGYLASNIWAAPSRVMFGFFVDVMMNRLHREGRLPAWQNNIWILAAVLCVIMAARIPKTWTGAFDLTMTTLVLAAILLVGIRTPAPGWIWKWSGELSYPIYMIHYPIMLLISPIIAGEPKILRETVYLAVPLLYIGCARIVFLWYDKPIRAALNYRPLSGMKPSQGS